MCLKDGLLLSEVKRAYPTFVFFGFLPSQHVYSHVERSSRFNIKVTFIVHLLLYFLVVMNITGLQFTTVSYEGHTVISYGNNITLLDYFMNTHYND